jgi:transposase
VNKRYRVTLTAREREELTALISKGTAKARVLAHARVLLQADESDGGPALTDGQVAAAVQVTVRTVERVRRLFVEEGPEAALRTHVPGARMYATKFDGEQEARLIALACSRPPDGRSRWTMRMLAGRLVELEVVDSVSHEAVRRALKKTRPSRT